MEIKTDAQKEARELVSGMKKTVDSVINKEREGLKLIGQVLDECKQYQNVMSEQQRIRYQQLTEQHRTQTERVAETETTVNETAKDWDIEF